MNSILNTLNSWDTSLFLFLNGDYGDFWDFIMWWASDKYIWIPLYALFLYALWRQYKRNIWVIIVFVALLIFLSDQISVHFFKDVFQRLRPCHEPGLEGMVHIVNNKCGGQYGFYSSHASNIFAVATFVISLFKKKNLYIISLVFFWAASIAYSRVYLGVHYPGDVLAGGIAGSILGVLLARFCKKAMMVKTA
jgi:undecaprenyl-diphosphatase